jgi:hypothetical protein
MYDYFAHAVQIDEIALALTKEDFQASPERAGFLASLQDALQQYCSDHPPVRFTTPCAELTKADVIVRRIELGVEQRLRSASRHEPFGATGDLPFGLTGYYSTPVRQQLARNQHPHRSRLSGHFRGVNAGIMFSAVPMDSASFPARSGLVGFVAGNSSSEGSVPWLGWERDRQPPRAVADSARSRPKQTRRTRQPIRPR